MFQFLVRHILRPSLQNNLSKLYTQLFIPQTLSSLAFSTSGAFSNPLNRNINPSILQFNQNQNPKQSQSSQTQDPKKEMGDLEKMARERVEKDPQDAGAYFLYGQDLLVHQKRPQDAAKLYIHTLQLNPYFWNAYQKLFYLRPEWTIKKLEEVSKTKDHCLVQYFWALALRNLSKREEAIEKFNKSTEINPNFTSGYAWAAMSLEELQRDSEAIQKYSKIIEICSRPGSVSRVKLPHAYFQRSLLLYHQGKFSEAFNDLHESIQILLEISPKAEHLDVLKEAVGDEGVPETGHKECYEKWVAAFHEAAYRTQDPYYILMSPGDGSSVGFWELTSVIPEEVGEDRKSEAIINFMA